MKIVLTSIYPDLYSYGIRMISACLKREGHDVELVFLPQQFTESYSESTLDQFCEMCRDADLIGLSLMTNFFDNSIQITKRLKETTSALVMWGGIHPTIRPEECVEHADIACIGEAEETVVELAQKIAAKESYENLNGIAFKKDGKAIRNPIRPLAQTLDCLPAPDYDYSTHYVLDNGLIKAMDLDLLKKHLGGIYLTIPTRGCPFKCTYCCNSAFNKLYTEKTTKIRKKSMDALIDELVAAKENLPFITDIKFDDDAFFALRVDEIKEFCEKYKARVRMPLMITGAIPSTVNRDKLAPLVDAGLYAIRMGIETASESTKKMYIRPQTNKRVIRAAEAINEFKDIIRKPLYDVILDNPFESDDDIVDTLMFLSQLPAPYSLSLFSLVFYPGTELYEKAKSEGLVKDDLNDVYRKHFRGCQNTFLNKLHFLLNDYASSGFRIRPWLMRILTNKTLRKLYISHLLYMILKPAAGLLRFKYLFIEGMRSIRKGDWARIQRYKQKPVYTFD